MARMPRAAFSLGLVLQYEQRRAAAGWLVWVLIVCLSLSTITARAQDPGDLDALSNRSRELQHAGKLEEARTVGERILALAEDRYGNDDPRVATALDFLGDVVHGQDPHAFRQVQTLYFRALHIREKALGSDHPDVAKSLSRIAYLYAGEHILDEAVRLRDRSVVIYTKMLDDLARQMRSLVDTGQYEEAVDIARRALADHGDGFVLADMGVSCAPELPRECKMLAWRARTLPALSTGPALIERAKLAREHGQLADAERLYQRGLAILEQIHLPLDPVLKLQLVTVLEGLAGVYEVEGRAGEAGPVRERIREIAEYEVHKLNEVAGWYRDPNLALSRKTDSIAGAELSYQRSIAIAEQVSHPSEVVSRDLIASLTGLASIYDVQGRQNEAATLRQRVRDIEGKAR
jgi:tetratricopeptide (TPR) repeat protein